MGSSPSLRFVSWSAIAKRLFSLSIVETSSSLLLRLLRFQVAKERVCAVGWFALLVVGVGGEDEMALELWGASESVCCDMEG